MALEAFKFLAEFSFLSGLKLNKEKFEVSGICVKKGVNVAVCEMKNIDLKKTQGTFPEFIILSTKNLKIKRILKIISENRDCSEILEDRKFNP